MTLRDGHPALLRLAAAAAAHPATARLHSSSTASLNLALQPWRQLHAKFQPCAATAQQRKRQLKEILPAAWHAPTSQRRKPDSSAGCWRRSAASLPAAQPAHRSTVGQPVERLRCWHSTIKQPGRNRRSGRHPQLASLLHASESVAHMAAAALLCIAQGNRDVRPAVAAAAAGSIPRLLPLLRGSGKDRTQQFAAGLVGIVLYFSTLSNVGGSEYSCRSRRRRPAGAAPAELRRCQPSPFPQPLIPNALALACTLYHPRARLLHRCHPAHDFLVVPCVCTFCRGYLLREGVCVL